MKKEFKSEVEKLLNLMINSIYTNKDIFLRELISNSSDAIDKLYYKSLTDKKIKVDKEKLEIKIDFDKDKRIITISDNGIGMTKEELEENLGTIAKSGSLEFKENLSSDEKTDIIGQFGVGFYSAFMVSKKLTVESKSINSKDAYIWESEGVDGFTITNGKKKDNGTIITLYIKDDSENENYTKYLDQYELKSLIKKYSDYISYPIKMNIKEIDADKKEKVTEEIINSMIPIWKKNKKDVSDEDYNNFYMDKFNDYDKPLKTITINVEGLTSFKAILYIPSHISNDFYNENYEKGLCLYSNGVLIMDKCSDLLPDYFAFVKGVVDSEDLSLNISRETLQDSHNLKLIAKNIESKIRKELESMLVDDRDNYISFFKTFGPTIKYGVYNNFGMDKDKLKDLIMFTSSKKNELITLREYVNKLKDKQEKIYYATGQSVEKIKNLPIVEQVLDNDFDVLLLTDYVDEFALTALTEYDGKKFCNVESEELDLSSDKDKEKSKKINEDNKDMLNKMKEILKDVEEVKFSNRLKKHPVSLTSKGDVSIEMQKVFDAMPNNMGIKAKKVLEISTSHPIYEKLKDMYKNDIDEFSNYTKILYSEAKLISGLPVDNPVEISKLICDILAK